LTAGVLEGIAFPFDGVDYVCRIPGNTRVLIFFEGIGHIVLGSASFVYPDDALPKLVGLLDLPIYPGPIGRFLSNEDHDGRSPGHLHPEQAFESTLGDATFFYTTLIRGLSSDRAIPNLKARAPQHIRKRRDPGVVGMMMTDKNVFSLRYFSLPTGSLYLKYMGSSVLESTRLNG
jgi:hypothetical protein